MDGATIHYLSEKQIYLEPLHLIEMRQKMRELAETLKSELEFTELLAKEGLLEFYFTEKFIQKAIT